MKEMLENINSKFNNMKKEASVWTSSWKDIAEWTRPSRSKDEGDKINDGTEFDAQHLLNGTSQLVVRTFASGMLGGMTSPSRKWFRLQVEDKELNLDNEVKQFLERAENAISIVFSKSNVYEVLYSMFEEIGLFATACAIIEEDYDTVIRLKNFTAGEYYLANDSTGRVNSMAREFTMTVSNVVEMFGIDNVSSNVKNSYDNKEFEKNVIVRHIIMPRKQIDSSKKDNLNMPYASYYWEKSSNENKFLRESGYKAFPVIAPRWGLVATSDVYGKNSPGWEGLGDAKMIQELEEDSLVNLALIAKNPLLVDADIDDYDLRPAGITRVSNLDSSNGVRPVDIVQADIERIDRKILRVEDRLGRVWYTDLFLMFSSNDDPRATATEIIKKDGEKMLVLAPALEKVNNEGLGPLIDITFTKLLEAGMLGDIPESLDGSEIKIEYISTIAQAQRMIGTSSIEQLIGFTGNLVAVDPTVLDNLDLDQAINEYADKLGVSAKIVRSKEAIAEIRQGRAEQQQKAEAQQEAGAMVQGAKVLSDTKIQDNTALSALMGE